MSLGAMQDWGMRISHVIDHAAREAPNREIVTRWADGSETRTDWAGVRRDAKKMSQALQALGLGKGDKVASLAMNHARHLVSWFGVAGMGGVLHTCNPRLFEDQLEYIVNHAEDKVMIYDAAFQPIVDKMRDKWPTVEHYICFDSSEHTTSFEDWIGEQDGDFEWVDGDERDPCMICYTSGTTGNPKGVQYEHRSTLLHALAGLQPSTFNFTASSVMLPVVPMFHAASWGLPYAGAMAGIKFVFSAVNDPAVLDEVMKTEKVTDSAGGVAGAFPVLRRQQSRTAQAARGDDRGFGRAALHDRTADEERHPRPACLGDDRDLAHRHRWRPHGRLGPADLRPEGREDDEAGSPDLRRRTADGRSR